MASGGESARPPRWRLELARARSQPEQQRAGWTTELEVRQEQDAVRIAGMIFEGGRVGRRALIVVLWRRPRAGGMSLRSTGGRCVGGTTRP
jgi:hypothetical protein